MKINMFEGARRIAKLIAVIWVVSVCIYVFNSKPYIHAYYRVDSPDRVPTRIGEQVSGCEVEDATEYLFSQHTSKGTDFSLELCFKPKLFDDGRKLIPYRIDVVPYADQLKLLKPFDPDAYLAAKREVTTQKDTKKSSGFDLTSAKPVQTVMLGNEKYSTEVSNYTKMVANGFRLTKADEEWADSKLWPARWENIKEGLLATVAGLAFLWIFSWGVGWIVRGFAGIPTGQDMRPEVKQTPVA